MKLKDLKQKIANNLDPNTNKNKLSLVNKVICFIAVVSFANAIIATEHSFYLKYQSYFIFMERFFFGVFFLEYIIRFWISDISNAFKKYKYKRLRFVFSFYALLDLVTLIIIIAPYFITSPTFLRVFRLIKILRIVKIGRFFSAIKRLKYALTSRAPDLFLTLFIAVTAMIFAASLLYFIESKSNPESFGSIPRAMWWAVVTLTTVGYGDVYPLTAIGKLVCGIIAIIGLGLIAMPAGILASAFSDAMKSERRIARKVKENKKNSN